MAELPTGSATTFRVESLTARHARIPLRSKIAHASHERSASDNLIVECRLNDGTVGFGESAPREYVTGETIDLSIDLLKRTDWGQINDVWSHFGAAVRSIRALQLPTVADDDRQCVGNAARCAVELSLLDAVCKRLGVPLSGVSMLPEYQSIFRPRVEVRYSGVVTSAGPRKEFFSALKMRLFGFNQIKIKVGTKGQDDVARMRRFRRLLPNRQLRIDANEAWTLEEAVEKLRLLEPFGISAVEQPLHHRDAHRLPELRKQTRIPIMLDESLCSMVDAQQAADEGRCDIFNIRLSKCGGFLRSLDLALFAKQRGLQTQLGCQVGETGVLSAAGRHFACSVDGLQFLEGSYDRFLVRERLTKENMTFGYGGRAPALFGPGLGVTVDREALQRVTVASHPLMGAANLGK